MTDRPVGQKRGYRPGYRSEPTYVRHASEPPIMRPVRATEMPGAYVISAGPRE